MAESILIDLGVPVPEGDVSSKFEKQAKSIPVVPACEPEAPPYLNPFANL